MCKKALLLIFSVFLVQISFAQYDDDAQGQAFDTSSRKRKSFFKAPSNENLVKGTEFMLSLNSGFVFGEISPFVGFNIAKPIMAGIGANAAFYSGGGQNNNAYTYGGHGFVRLKLGQVAFLHAEMRGVNALTAGGGPLSSSDRKWVASPILGIGIAQSSNMSSWFLIGYASNADYASTQPLGSIVYRIGLTF